MHPSAVPILADLEVVRRERSIRRADPVLAKAVDEVKAYQHRRFERTYADLLAGGTEAAAARFFLDELYGPRDFTRRDTEFERVIPTLARLFPADVVQTVASLAALHALSECLDTLMARALSGGTLDALTYVAAWQRTGRADDRARQIALTVEVGRDLARLTRKTWLRHSLHLMRGPAHAAGLGALQEVLETGFDTFGSLPDPQRFLGTIEARERTLSAALFSHPWGAKIDPQGTLRELP